ncbi:MAG: transposase [Kiritimatiellae bacterium]|nr:transposase [Kiritimatiellia bacterium]
MSRRTTMEYVGTQRRAYAQLKSKSKKTAFIDSMCQAFGFERKYATKLLTGNRKYKDPRGRGKTYSDRATGLLKRVWYATGCMCTKYLKAIIAQALANLAELEHVDDALSGEVASMSASTMDRALRGLERKGPGSVRKNRRSGKNDPATYFACCSGEKTIAAETEPGHLQVDTVALCGGDMHGSFFWIITLTDRKTQWTEIHPVWNKGAEEVLNAMETLVKRFPFKILSLHYDNGKEFMNGHLVTFVKMHPEISFQRSRPYRKNDNAHVEQKNGSIVRGLFGEVRVDAFELRSQLASACAEWSDYFNYCRPCIMITQRAKKDKSKGFGKRYDKPRLPAQRVLDEHVASDAREAHIKARIEKTNGIELYRFVLRRWSRILRRQRATEKGRGSTRVPDNEPAMAVCK